MLQIIKETRIPFMAFRRRTYFISLAIFVVGIASLVMHQGLRLGIDFAGGRLIEFRFDEQVTADELRSVLSDIQVGGEVQSIGSVGSDFLIRIPDAGDASVSDLTVTTSVQFMERFAERNPEIAVDLRREELVGPRVGAELRQKAIWAVVVALALILLYVGVRFEFKFAIGGVAALAHDVLVTLFVFSLLDIEITIPIIAALLTIGGYSINDTVVVFDRIRENSRTMIGHHLQEVMDLSINATLSRTLVTSVTTFLAAGALYFLGGEVIHDFALAILIGIIVGTYSSIYVASALALEISGNPKISVD